VSDLVGTVDAPINSGGATVKTTSDVSTETGSVAPESSQDGQERAGGSQESTEGGSATDRQTRTRGPSKLDTIRELRGRLRDERSQREEIVGNLQTRLDQLEASLKSSGDNRKPGKSFWEAPEETIEEKIGTHLSQFEKRLLSQLNERQVVDQETSEWRQETTEATKFIKTQRGLTDDDEQDIAEIVQSTPAMKNMRPMERAEYALFLWQKQKGITDKSVLKAKAAPVIGAPPSLNGQRVWTEAEIIKEVGKFPNDPRTWTDDMKKQSEALDREIRSAYREGRVKK